MSSTVNLIVSIFLLISPCLCKQCVGNGPCSCDFDDGSGTVDLTSIGNEVGSARFERVPSSSDSFLYNYNPCFAFDTGSCTNVAVCQTTPELTEFYNLGGQDSATWSYDGSNIQVYYSATTEIFRETFVTAICDPDLEEPIVTVQGETSPQQYHLELRSQCACAGGCSALGPPDEGLSGGTILLILVIVFGFIYLVAGMTFNRYRGGKEGVEMLPNRGFWSALPGLVKDGAVFTIGCIKQRGSTYDKV
ncbi:uncharacterized protein [Haliotis cracherodii]|uniref:uncharacterized protein n=1 Tax=Haliotis cracherodii TaxID=6455 RepID=UPI0039EA1981